MTPPISAVGLSRRYRDQIALDDVTIDIKQDAITGLLGRNGAGKSTLLRVISAQEFATAGIIRVFGENPVENDRVLRRMVLLREDQRYPDFKVRHAIQAASWFYPHWDGDLAGALLADFALPPNRAIKKLSRGMRSAVGIVIGLAARAELTLLDEPYAGLDAAARQLFYDRLLADYADHPRTILLSTHLIDEIAGLLDHVVIIDRGRIALDASAKEARDSAATVSGPAAAVQKFVAGRRTWHRQVAAPHAASVIVAGAISDSDRARARELSLSLEPLSLQQLAVHISGRPADERTSA